MGEGSRMEEWLFLTMVVIVSCSSDVFSFFTEMEGVGSDLVVEHQIERRGLGFRLPGKFVHEKDTMFISIVLVYLSQVA